MHQLLNYWWLLLVGVFLLAAIRAENGRKAEQLRADRAEVMAISLRADTTLLSEDNRALAAMLLKQNDALDSLITLDSIMAIQLATAEAEVRAHRRRVRREADEILLAEVPQSCDSAMQWLVWRGREIVEGW